MSDEFSFDVFLSHSSKDKAVVRAVAERLRKDGLRVWFDEWVLKPGDNLPKKIDDGLEQSRVLVLCMSANAFGSDWAQLEAGTFRFRDPLNQERRFIPLRLDETPIKGALAPFLYVNWLAEDREREYAKLLEACRPQAQPRVAVAEPVSEQAAEKAIQLDYKADIHAYAFSADGERALSGSNDNTVRLWDLGTGSCLRVLKGHTGPVWSVALGADRRRAVSGSWDNTIRLWDLETGVCLRLFEGHKGHVYSLAWSADQHRILSGAYDRTIGVWDLETGCRLGTFEGHTHDWVNSVVGVSPA